VVAGGRGRRARVGRDRRDGRDPKAAAPARLRADLAAPRPRVDGAQTARDPAGVGAGIVGFRGALGFAFAGALLVACTGFLVALARAVQQSIPCACFGRLGRTAAGGREIGRGMALVAGAAFLVAHRALDAGTRYGAGPLAAASVVVTGLVIVAAQRVGARVRPGVELGDGNPGGGRSLAGSMRALVGYDNDLYTSGS
jgi:hypothetical protein